MDLQLTAKSIFLMFGLLTIVTSPFVYWKLDNSVEDARFLNETEREQAVERLRANNTGIASRDFQWKQVFEVFLEPKSYLFVAMGLCINVGTSMTNVFGPLILKGLGYDKYITSLLNIPFGAVQFLVILGASYAAQKAKLKSAVLIFLTIPGVVGCIMLYVLTRTASNQAPLLVAFYLLAFLYGANPLLVVWVVGNTAGTTKKTVMMVFLNIGVSAGGLIGPLLFNARDAPKYLPGLKAVMGVLCTLVVLIVLQLLNLMFLNKRQSSKRVAAGKPANIKDRSMQARYSAETEDEAADRNGDAALHDLTDGKNDEFVFIY